MVFVSKSSSSSNLIKGTLI